MNPNGRLFGEPMDGYTVEELLRPEDGLRNGFLGSCRPRHRVLAPEI